MPAPGANEDPQCTSGHAPGLYEHGMLRPLQLAAYGRAQGAGGTLACARMLVYKSGRARARALAGVDGQARGGRGVKPSVPVVTRWLASSDFTYAAIRVIHADMLVWLLFSGVVICSLFRLSALVAARRQARCPASWQDGHTSKKLKVYVAPESASLSQWPCRRWASLCTGARTCRVCVHGAQAPRVGRRVRRGVGRTATVPFGHFWQRASLSRSHAARAHDPGKQGSASMLRWWSAAGDSDRHATSVKGRPGSWCARRRAGLVLCLGRSAVRNETWSAAAHMSTNATAVT